MATNEFPIPPSNEYDEGLPSLDLKDLTEEELIKLFGEPDELEEEDPDCYFTEEESDFPFFHLVDHLPDIDLEDIPF